MRTNSLLLLLTCFCLGLGTGCSEDNNGCDLPEDRRLKAETLNAIPHTDAQIVTYTVSDGTELRMIFRGGINEATELNGCNEQFIMEFSGSSPSQELSGAIDAYPSGFGPTDIFYVFNIPTASDHRLIVELLPDGRITAGRNANARVIAEYEREGEIYFNVLEQNYNNPNPGELKKVYYNTDLGLLGVDLVGGFSMWRR
ncbi:hypothetical protein [Lewinella sp. 4G2]|uniref:hypothetical protein n=1 Tax=Lewinella sp. 4G2 TaxID=1803372 RepID=UPI0007B498CC|nr:hypothetical protein [Lewinella sp. 4G2]OAV42782.1 hypothetical protein A3850_016220 [Lewinella sp. 4G2]